jgi:hypothetical protein
MLHSCIFILLFCAHNLLVFITKEGRIWLINIVETIEKNIRDIWRLESRSWWG